MFTAYKIVGVVGSQIRDQFSKLAFVEVGEEVFSDGNGSCRQPIKVKAGICGQKRVRAIVEELKGEGLPIQAFCYPLEIREESFEYDPKEHFEILYHEPLERRIGMTIDEIMKEVNIPDSVSPVGDWQFCKDTVVALKLYYGSIHAAAWDYGVPPGDSRKLLEEILTDPKTPNILGRWISEEIKFLRKKALRKAS